MIRAREDRLFERFVKNGDVRALALAFERTAPELWRVAAALCRDRHRVEDLVQDTFLVAIEDAASWDAGQALLPWLLGILVNRARHERRQARRQPETARLARGAHAHRMEGLPARARPKKPWDIFRLGVRRNAVPSPPTRPEISLCEGQGRKI